MAEIDEVTYRYGAEVTELRKAMAAVAADFEAIDKAAVRTGNATEHSFGMAERALIGLTDRTREAVRHIHGLNNASDASAKGLSQATSTTRNYGLAIQNTSFQVADFAVQVAGGTRWTQALGQQLPQLLGGFGVLGAAIGAVVAVGGALIPVLMDTRSASEEMEDALDGLNDYLKSSNALLKEMKNGLSSVADEFARADAFQQSLIRSNLEESIRKGTTAINEQAAAIRSLASEQEIYMTVLGGRDFRPQTEMGIAGTASGVSRSQAFELSEALKSFEQSDGGLDALKDLADVVVALRAELDGASPEFTAFADSLLESIQSAAKSAQATEDLKLQLEDLGKRLPTDVEGIKALNKAFEESSEAAVKSAKAARDLVEEYNPLIAAKNEAYTKILELRDGLLSGAIAAEDYALAISKIKKELEEALDPIGTVIDEMQNELILLKLSDDARERSKIIKEKLNEITKKGGVITQEVRNQVADYADAIIKQTKANKDASDAEKDAERARDKLSKDIDRVIDKMDKLSTKRKETWEEMERELKRSKELYEAQIKGQDAVDELTDRYEAEDIALRLNIDLKSKLVDKIFEVVRATNQQTRATDELADVQKEQKKKEEELLKARVDQARDILEDVSDEVQDVFSDLASNIDGSFKDMLETLRNRFIGWLGDLAYQAALKPIVIQVGSSVLGGITGQSGVFSQAAGAINSSSPFGGVSPLSFLNGGGLYNNFAMSGLGQSLGLSYGVGSLATNAGVFAAGSGALGTFAAGGPAALALTGPAGGMGTVAGLATASSGGAVGAATAGGSLAASGGLTGIGASLGAAMPYIGVGLAALALIGPMLFKGQPSVGPVGVADFSPGLGRRNAFDVDGIDPFTADNGGDGESLRPIAEAIADLIEDSADRWSATINESLRYRIANYEGPEKGSGRTAGFEVNAFINQEAERRVAEGLSQEQAMFEALKFAVQEAFTFDSATIAEAAANTAATTTEEIFADLDFAKDFERLGQALEDLGGTVDANTLALAQYTVQIQKQAEDFAATNAQPILDRFEKARELFPAVRSSEESRQVTERGVYVSEGEGKRDQRFVEEDTDEFDRLVASGSKVVTRIRTISEEVDAQADNYADNMERIRLASQIANASVELLVDQVTGEFEPAVRGPFQIALEQGRANIEELATYFDDLNEQIMEANEQFPGLNAALIDTNTVITDAMDALRVSLQESYNDSITQQMNEATGIGAINTAQDLIDLRDQNISDASVLGLDPGQANALFKQQVKNLFDTVSLDKLGEIRMSDQITDADTLAALDETIVRKAEEFAIQQLIVANNELISKRKTEAEEARRLAEAAESNAEMLRQAVQSNIIDPSVSPLSPGQQYEAALQQFRDAAALATDDDPTDDESQDAVKRLPGLQDQLLKLALTNFGADERYYAAFDESQQALLDIADEQSSIAEQQLEVLERIEAEIEELNIANETAAGGFGTSYQRLDNGQYISNTGFDLGYDPDTNLRILNTLAAAGLSTPTGFGEGQLGPVRSNPAANAIIEAIVGRNSGGIIPSTDFSVSGSDTVPVMATPGEFMIREPAARSLGTATLNYMNASGNLPSAGDDSKVVSAIYVVADAVDRLAQQQSAEHREGLGALGSVRAAVSSAYLAGRRQ